MTVTNETYMDQEVRVRLLESIAGNIDKRFDKLEQKIDSNYHWTLGIVIALFCGTILPFFGGVILHMAKII